MKSSLTRDRWYLWGFFVFMAHRSIITDTGQTQNLHRHRYPWCSQITRDIHRYQHRYRHRYPRYSQISRSTDSRILQSPGNFSQPGFTVILSLAVLGEASKGVLDITWWLRAFKPWGGNIYSVERVSLQYQLTFDYWPHPSSGANNIQTIMMTRLFNNNNNNNNNNLTKPTIGLAHLVLNNNNNSSLTKPTTGLFNNNNNNSLTKTTKQGSPTLCSITITTTA